MSENAFMESIIALPWYITHTTEGGEEHLLNELRTVLGKTAEPHYCFVVEKAVRKLYHGETEDKISPQFPGYVFICSAEIDEVVKLCRQRGTRLQILQDQGMGELKSGTTDGMYVALGIKDKELLLHLMEWRELQRINTLIRVSRGAIINDRLKATEGPLVGLEDYITSVNRHRMKAKIDVPTDEGTRSLWMSVELEKLTEQRLVEK